jgi:hypothetical protein
LFNVKKKQILYLRHKKKILMSLITLQKQARHKKAGFEDLGGGIGGTTAS